MIRRNIGESMVLIHKFLNLLKCEFQDLQEIKIHQMIVD